MRAYKWGLSISYSSSFFVIFDGLCAWGVIQTDSLILVKGTVRSSDDKLSMQAVYVATKDRKINTLTDKNGNFSILVPKKKQSFWFLDGLAMMV